ncbi:hypothetical protein [Bordetella hinzii]|uniref:Uncharacterized protein n=1 Tax=Bordetella hinzii OH87 BAL007II TaxID=1331262 RepID=A0ABR4R4W4_9BORD|nr:hypothetical protein [Bordetella hinzii]KCB25978.1 hypothetical protein L544_3265 [Bordetella hinzii OH87 BAL007II]
MNEQNSAVQPLLTGDEIRAAVRQAHSMTAPSDTTEPGDYVMAGVRALLSKLRAPVADERAAFEADYAESWNAAYNNTTSHTAQEVAVLRDGDGYGAENVYLNARWEGWQRRAALASAPVAGEAVAWVSDTAGATDNPKLAETWRKMGWPVRPLVYGDAAPQGSAEPVSDAGTAASGDVVLPPLPFPAPRHIRAAQMKEYARAAVLADRQQRGGDVGEHGAFWWRKGLRATLAPQPAAPHSDLERARQGLPPYNPSMPTEQDWQRITENGRKAWGGAQPAASAEPSDEEIDAIAASMPDGAGGMLKQWGYRQFARALLSRYGRHAGDAEYPLAAKVCAELYQVIGSLASDLGVFDHPKVVKALDNAADHALVHDDVLPFPSFEHKTAGEAQPVACLRRQSDGSDWGHWKPASVEDGQRVTGLRSWQVRWLVDAAPQASAENLRNAALEEAAAVAKRISDKYAFGHYGNETDTADEIEREILALKTQADKDGGQQRNWVSDWSAAIKSLPMGRADAEGIRSSSNACMYRNECRAMLDRLRAAFDHPVFAFLLGEGPLHGVHFGDRHPSERGAYWWRKDLRAALSAAQADTDKKEM